MRTYLRYLLGSLSGAAALLSFAQTSRAQTADDAGAPPPVVVVDAAAPPAAPLTKEELDRLIDARLAERGLLQADGGAAPTAPSAVAAPSNDHDFKPEKEPFAFADFSWVPGNYAPSESPLKWGPFKGELRVDTVYHWEATNPKDDTISGSSEVFRHNEFQVTQLGVGGDFYYKGVQARLMTQFGMYSQTTPRNDASTGKGGWNLDNAYRYISEAYGGYHFDVMHGLNLQAGIFMSYVGLWSYYNFDNWTYQPSYVSSNTPWFFNGARIQFFPTEKLKIEPWFVNGWQSYGKFNEAPGVGLQIQYRPNSWLSILGNQYFGADTLGQPDRKRIHTDDSVMAKFYDNPSGALSKLAASLTFDAGCEFGGKGTTSAGDTVDIDCGSQLFVGFMSYARAWFLKNHLAATVGGGAIHNPGRYLVLIPPINGATAFSGTPYFTANPKDPFTAWDMQITADWMPREFITFRFELNHRFANVPYFSGSGGLTPPGGNTGTPAIAVPGWNPDLVKEENRLSWAMMVRY